MHGYELRKRLYTVLGAFRALSYGSLYPCLHELEAAGLIAAEQDEAEPSASAGTAPARAVRRRGTTTGSVFTSRFSGRRGPTCGSGSSRAGAAGSRNAWKPSGRP